MNRTSTVFTRGAALTAVALILSGCGGSLSDLDWDLRPSDRFSTTEGARAATAARPAADARGIISYPGYQVVVAQRGDTVEAIAARLNLNASELARHNAVQTDTALRGGELLVLPSRIEDTGLSSGTITATPLTPATAGPEPTQHTVRRGETAFTIARLYNVSPRALSEWNGLPPDMSVREGQILMIPVTQTATIGAPLSATGVALTPATVGATVGAAGATATAAVTPDTVSQPGTGSTTPTPPSATQPLPAEAPAPTGLSAGSTETPPVADMAAQRTEQSRLAMPVDGRIIRAYAQGRNDGIGIGAAAGTQVRAAASGTVAAITTDTDQVPILVIRHENNLLTVYANLENITVARGDRVTRGQSIATVRQGDPSFLHFEVREGFESVDPMPYLR